MKVTSPLVEESTYQASLLQWYRDKALGQRLTQQLSEALNEALEQVFGYHMLVTGADIGLEFSRIGKTQRLFRLATRTNPDQPFQAVVGASSELPFATDSLDALVLCHTLNTSPLPHEVLRECQRVLMPNGHLFIISFQSFQFLGCRQLPQKTIHTSPQSGCWRECATPGRLVIATWLLTRRATVLCKSVSPSRWAARSHYGLVRPYSRSQQYAHRCRVSASCP
ncbi:MAG: hypothetical protein CM15mP84_07760 [Cellvibrionales bacterium]|nr:MAG: hypothetical protein CM15mP84_07760 [Cellvibrionales bacterium]